MRRGPAYSSQPIFILNHYNRVPAARAAIGQLRDVIEALRTALPGHPLRETEEVLRDCGNMSSPSVLIALHRALEAGVRDPLWLTAFGAGFSAHSCRLDLE